MEQYIAAPWILWVDKLISHSQLLGPGKAQEPRHQRKDGDQGHVAPKDFGGLQVVNMGPPWDPWGLEKAMRISPETSGPNKDGPHVLDEFLVRTRSRKIWKPGIGDDEMSDLVNSTDPKRNLSLKHKRHIFFSMKLGTTSNVREGTCHTASLINKNHQH